ncbi:replication-relaxation family protein [Streptomyces fulvoviolaceus]|uniref:replication-relaxation family protein n=1 Tax=Streptomyces fulvoviolaceus TaxID=285535 RepID=UPI001F2A11E3|nr:replication-relaxation family protein [Streptomyces fulvoviolaceus]
MIGVDVGSGDRLALGVLAQYRMATTDQMHRVIAPKVRIEQTRRRLARLRTEGLIDRITLPQAGRTRVWFPTAYGVQLASEWPEMRGHRPSKAVSHPTAVRLKAGHTLTVTETALVFLEDARRRGELCRPLDWIPEVHHPIGGGEAVIPDALLYYRCGPVDGEGGAMLRAFVEVDRATMGPERLAAKLSAYERLYHYVPAVPGRRPTLQEPAVEEWRRRYPLFPRILFVLDGTGPAGVDNRIGALHAGARLLAPSRFPYDVPVLVAPLANLLHHGPPPHPCGVPSTTPTSGSPGPTLGIDRRNARATAANRFQAGPRGAERRGQGRQQREARKQGAERTGTGYLLPQRVRTRSARSGRARSDRPALGMVVPVGAGPPGPRENKGPVPVGRIWPLRL